MPILQVGEVAPDFELQADSGEMVKLSDFRGKQTVLFFYPRADTPGCTKEACGFRDDYRAFGEKNVTVLGISPDTVKAQSRFKSKYELPYLLLADAEHAVADAYGVWGKKKFMGREYFGVLRTSFIIDSEGKVSHVFEKVKPANHSGEVLTILG